MRLIDSYLIKSFLKPFFYCMFAFIILYITYDVSINLDMIIKNKVSFFKLLTYYSINVPFILINSTPIAILLSLLYSLGQMNRHHEIVAMRASGIHIDRIIAPFLIIGAMFSLIVFLINDQIVCRYSYEEKALRQEIFDDEPQQVSTLWNKFPFRNPAANRDWFIEQYDFSVNEMKGVTVREFADDGHMRRKVIAEHAKWENSKWIFFNGTIYHYTADGLPAMTNTESGRAPEPFENLTMEYNVTPEDFENSRRDIGSMNFRALLRYLKMQNKGSVLYRKIQVDLHYKIAFPFVCIIAILIGIPFAVKTQRGGFIKGIGISIIIFLAYYGISIISLSLGKQGMLLPVIAVWIPNIAFLCFGGYLIKTAA
ncbi:MAG: LptF/LptG family permease [Candidatus Auribacterota bacterium]